MIKIRLCSRSQVANPGPGEPAVLHISCSNTTSSQEGCLISWLVESGMQGGRKTLKCARNGLIYDIYCGRVFTAWYVTQLRMWSSPRFPYHSKHHGITPPLMWSSCHTPSYCHCHAGKYFYYRMSNCIRHTHKYKLSHSRGFPWPWPSCAQASCCGRSLSNHTHLLIPSFSNKLCLCIC